MTRFNIDYKPKMDAGRRVIHYVGLTEKAYQTLPISMTCQSIIAELKKVVDKRRMIGLLGAFDAVEQAMRSLLGISEEYKLDDVIDFYRPNRKRTLAPVKEHLFGVAGQYYFCMRYFSQLEINGYIIRLDKKKKRALTLPIIKQVKKLEYDIQDQLNK